MAEKKQTDKQRLDSVLASDPNIGLTEGMMSAGVDEITMDEDLDVKPVSKFGPGEENLLLDEPGFEECGISEDGVEKRLGLPETSMDYLG